MEATAQKRFFVALRLLRMTLKRWRRMQKSMLGIFPRLLPALWLFAIVSVVALSQTFAAQSSAPGTKIMASYGGELGYQAPLWMAHDLKLFAKQGISSELIRIAGGSRSMAALFANATQVSQSAGVSPVQVDLAGGDAVIVATSTNRAAVSIVAQPKTIKKPQDLVGRSVGLVGRGEMKAKMDSMKEMKEKMAEKMGEKGMKLQTKESKVEKNPTSKDVHQH